jgi:hypothetical protein
MTFSSFDDLLEQFPLVDQVRQPPRARLLFELRSRAVRLPGEQFFHARAESFRFGFGKEARQDQISLLFQLFSCGFREHKRGRKMRRSLDYNSV